MNAVIPERINWETEMNERLPEMENLLSDAENLGPEVSHAPERMNRRGLCMYESFFSSNPKT